MSRITKDDLIKRKFGMFHYHQSSKLNDEFYIIRTDLDRIEITDKNVCIVVDVNPSYFVLLSLEHNCFFEISYLDEIFFEII